MREDRRNFLKYAAVGGSSQSIGRSQCSIRRLRFLDRCSSFLITRTAPP